ncbi:MAG: menaquinone biosynthesis protein [Acidobacteriota bacterium]|nr:menaquinone biosynthesis protein [Acidobacteriota bacterium]
MWDFEHPPRNTALAEHYTLHYTRPALCAQELLAGRADLGLIPIAALTPELAVVPGCTIASLHEVRSIQLIVKHPHTLQTVRRIAADTASRSSLAYASVLFRHFLGTEPHLSPAPADPVAMLRSADAAIIIGDPALLAVEQRAAIEAAVGPCHWYDLAQQWHQRTGLPWVAAVWAVRPQALSPAHLSAAAITTDLSSSRDHGLANIPTLVREWAPRISVPAPTIEHYLTRNIHYHMDEACLAAIRLFRQLAAQHDVLPPLGALRLLD